MDKFTGLEPDHIIPLKLDAHRLGLVLFALQYLYLNTDEEILDIINDSDVSLIHYFSVDNLDDVIHDTRQHLIRQAKDEEVEEHYRRYEK